jgi:FtsP/CotA-like multicopper oxidase with cupredoxin domain
VHFNAGEPGSYLYWATMNEAANLLTRRSDEGTMSGAFVVDPPGSTADDRILVIELWARGLYSAEFQGLLTVNGKSWPATERLQAHVGQPEHWRILNATPLSHPMHLHGFYFHVDAVGDGETEQQYTDDQRRLVVTENVMGGHTFDMTWTPERAGNWLFHCHIFDHMTMYAAPNLFGPAGPPAGVGHTYMSHGGDGMGMAKLVLGITVTDDRPHITPAKAVVEPAAERHLIARERPASAYVPAGPGFYLEGVSHSVDAIGPPLVITRGERTAIRVTNELKEPTAIHWHGIEIESYYDGIPGWTGTAKHTTPPITPGSSFVAYMTPPRAGTFIYHTHWHDVEQLAGGMYGALLVLTPGEKYDPATDKVFVLGRTGLDDFRDPLVLNGSPQPPTMILLLGQKYRMRFINITPNDAAVAMSLTTEGHPVKWRAVAKDGADLPEQQAVVEDAVQPISVGETYDYEFTPNKRGLYELRFCSPLGMEVTQVIFAVPSAAPISVFAKR